MILNLIIENTLNNQETRMVKSDGGCLFWFRLHAQALTLAALAGAAVVEYYDHKSGAKSERYAKFLPPIDSYSHKD